MGVNVNAFSKGVVVVGLIKSGAGRDDFHVFRCCFSIWDDVEVVPTNQEQSGDGLPGEDGR